MFLQSSKIVSVSDVAKWNSPKETTKNILQTLENFLKNEREILNNSQKCENIFHGPGYSSLYKWMTLERETLERRDSLLSPTEIKVIKENLFVTENNICV